MCIIDIRWIPLDLVDLLLNLQTLEIVKLLLVALEFCHDLVLRLLLSMGKMYRVGTIGVGGLLSLTLFSSSSSLHRTSQYLICRSFQNDYTAASVSNCKIIARRVEFHGRDNISCRIVD